MRLKVYSYFINAQLLLYALHYGHLADMQHDMVKCKKHHFIVQEIVHPKKNSLFITIVRPRLMLKVKEADLSTRIIVLGNCA